MPSARLDENAETGPAWFASGKEVDYQNATLKIVSGRLGSPSGRSGRLRE